MIPIKPIMPKTIYFKNNHKKINHIHLLNCMDSESPVYKINASKPDRKNKLELKLIAY